MKNKIIKLFRLDKTIKIDDILLTVDWSDPGGRQYNSRSSFEEYHSEFYNHFHFKNVYDIGANYGFTGLVFAKRWGAKVTMIEPIPKLCRYIYKNFRLNGIEDFDIINAVVGDDNRTRYFYISQNSQDSRVYGKGKKIIVNEMTLEIEDNSFIKIDVQGYEEYVLAGLKLPDNWMMKMEFAPDWLLSQGTYPLRFLYNLVEKYRVYEYSNTYLMKFKKLGSLNVLSFVKSIKARDRNDRGWCDLIIMPR